MCELIKCPHCNSSSVFIHQEDNLCLCGECGEAWEPAAKAQAMPEGWKLVPEKPTGKMIDAAFNANVSLNKNDFGPSCVEIYKVMLASAPIKDAE